MALLLDRGFPIAYAADMQVMPVYGAMGGISDEIDKLISGGLVRQVGVSAMAPAGVPIVTISDLQKQFGPPLYKKWWFWAGTAVLLGGGFLLFRRK